jgi:antitoxin YefM
MTAAALRPRHVIASKAKQSGIKIISLSLQENNGLNMKMASFTDLRNNLKSYLDGVINDCEPLIVNRSKSNRVVIISLEEYNAITETEYILSSPETVKQIKEADMEIKEGKGYKQKSGESVSEFLDRVACIE